MDWNIVIAIAAVISIFMNIITLRQTRRLFIRQKNIDLFEKKYEVLEYLISLTNDQDFPIIKNDNIDKFIKMKRRISLLFDSKITDELLDFCDKIYRYNRYGIKLPDYTERYKDILTDAPIDKIKEAYYKHMEHCIGKLKDDLIIE